MASPVSALEWILEAVEPGVFCTSSLSPDEKRQLVDAGGSAQSSYDTSL